MINKNDNYIVINSSEATIFVMVDQQEKVIDNETYIDVETGKKESYEFKQYVIDIVLSLVRGSLLA